MPSGFDRGASSSTRVRRALQRWRSNLVGAGLTTSASTGELAIDLAAISGLEFQPDTDALRIDLDTNPGLELATTGIKVLVDPNAHNLMSLGAAGVLVSNLLSLDLKFATIGKGLFFKEGTNGAMGTAVLVGGTVTVNNTKITASSRVFLTAQVVGGTQGTLSLGAVVAGTSFVINSSNAADTSTVAWVILEPV